MMTCHEPIHFMYCFSIATLGANHNEIAYKIAVPPIRRCNSICMKLKWFLVYGFNFNIDECLAIFTFMLPYQGANGRLEMYHL